MRTRLQSLSPGDAVAAAVKAMEDHAIRRLPGMHDGTLVGMVSIGDLATEPDPSSALGEISAAAPNN
jgi:CBS domain-containing protein